MGEPHCISWASARSPPTLVIACSRRMGVNVLHVNFGALQYMWWAGIASANWCNKKCPRVRKSLLQCLSSQEISGNATKAQELMSLNPIWLSWALLPSLVPSEAKYAHNWNDKGSPANRLLASGWSHNEPASTNINSLRTLASHVFQRKILWKSRKQCWNSTCLFRTSTFIFADYIYENNLKSRRNCFLPMLFLQGNAENTWNKTKT
jgi:hypothetical protein